MPRNDRRKAKQWSMEDLSSGDDDAAAAAPAPTERRPRKSRVGGTVVKADSSDEDAPTTPTRSIAPGVVSIAHVADGQQKETPGLRRKRQNTRGDEEVEDDAPMEAEEEGETAEVPPSMREDVGGRGPFDSVPREAPASEVPTEALEKRLSIGAKGDDVDMGSDEEESEEEPTEFKCDRVGCSKPPFATLRALKAHQKHCKCPEPELVPVNDAAAAALADFDRRLAAEPNKANLVIPELRQYKDSSETKRWSPAKKLTELRKLIANGAKKIEKNDPVKPVVAWLASEGAGAQRYLFEGGRKQASRDAELNFAGETGYTAGSTALCELIADVADGKVKHDIVGARWPTDDDWNDATIIKIARDKGGGNPRISMARIVQETKDDRAKHATRVEAADAADAAAFQGWCRVANATPNFGAPVWTRKVDESGTPYWEDEPTGRTRSDDPWAFVETPRVAVPTEPEALKLAIAATYASRPRGRGLGDLISPDPEVRARAVAAKTGGAAADDASRAH